MFSFGLVYRRRVPDLKVLICREVHKSYYDSLGLTPKASQGDIKNAYYKMSMVYHPDKEEGNHVKFQEISTAYEVLSNSKLRKLYDKGLLPAGAAHLTDIKVEKAPPSSSTAGSSQNQSFNQQDKRYQNYYENINASEFGESARSKGPHTGKTEHYDFDAWTRAHYSEMFTKQKFKKTERDRILRARFMRFRRLDNIATTFFVMLVFVVLYKATTIHHNDHVIVYNKKKDD